MTTQTIKNNWQYLFIGVLVLGIIASVTWAYNENQRADKLTVNTMQTNRQEDTSQHLEEHGITPLTTSEASNK